MSNVRRVIGGTPEDDRKIRDKHIMAGVNKSNGFPYAAFGFRRNDTD